MLWSFPVIPKEPNFFFLLPLVCADPWSDFSVVLRESTNRESEKILHEQVLSDTSRSPASLRSSMMFDRHSV